MRLSSSRRISAEPAERRAISAKPSVSIPMGNVSARPLRPKATKAPVGFRRTAADLRHAAQKSVAVLVGLESGDIIGAQRFDQALVTRQGDHDFRRRKRRVQEKADAIVDAELAQCASERDEMIILYPNQIIRLDQRREHGSEAAVDREISLRGVAAIFDQPQPEMEERPKRGIRIAGVIEFVLGRRESCQCIGDIAAREGTRLGRHRLLDLAAPSEPQAAIRLQRLAYRNGESAGTSLTPSGKRHTIRYDDKPRQQSAPLKPGDRTRLNDDAQQTSRPVATRRLAARLSSITASCARKCTAALACSVPQKKPPANGPGARHRAMKANPDAFMKRVWLARTAFAPRSFGHPRFVRLAARTRVRS